MIATRNSGPKPKILRIVTTDGLSVCGLILALPGVIFLPMIMYEVPERAYFGLLFPLSGLVLLYARAKLIRRVFSGGEEVTARVSSSVVIQGAGNIPEWRTRLAYNFRGKEYEVQTYLFSKSFRRPILSPGNEVVLILDPSNPSRVFVRDLFL
jgi:hypothetical protein